MIRVEQLRKQFGSVTAVNGVTFTAENGAITGLLGPNGASKTTTLRMLYSVMRPDSGSITLDDIDAIANPHEAQGRLGVLPDGFGLYPRLTAREHLEYFGELHGISGPALRQRTKGSRSGTASPTAPWTPAATTCSRRKRGWPASWRSPRATCRSRTGSAWAAR